MGRVFRSRRSAVAALVVVSLSMLAQVSMVPASVLAATPNGDLLMCTGYVGSIGYPWSGQGSGPGVCTLTDLDAGGAQTVQNVSMSVEIFVPSFASPEWNCTWQEIRFTFTFGGQPYLIGFGIPPWQFSGSDSGGTGLESLASDPDEGLSDTPDGWMVWYPMAPVTASSVLGCNNPFQYDFIGHISGVWA